MMVTEQVDALRMCGVEPIEYLIAPRFIAALFMTVWDIYLETFDAYLPEVSPAAEA